MKYSRKVANKCLDIANGWQNIAPTKNIFDSSSIARLAVAEYIANRLGYTIYQSCATEVEKE